MSRRNWQRMFSILVLAGMVLSIVQPGGVQAAQPVTDGLDKIEALVLEQLRAEGTTDFFVWMTEKADLSPAAALKTKEEKGQFVYDALRATADRTQEGLLRELSGRGAEYESFYIANKVLVRGGTEALVLEIAMRPDVARITANHQYQLQEPFKALVAEGPTAVESNIAFVNADDVWALGVDGSGTVMAGNDTGLDWDHPALINQYRGWDGVTADHNYNWWDATGTYPNVPDDGHGHGTHTSGTMVGDDGVGNQVGMAPGARLVHCKNMTDGGGGNDTTFTTCFQWDLAPWDLTGSNPMPSLAPDAINNSWGYLGGGANQFRDEVLALQAAGIVVEVSAGNEGPNCGTLRSPGDYRDVITTGSVNHAGGMLPGTLTGFSSRGPSSLDGNYFPDVMAPGENIRSSVPGGGFQGGWSGTSMSGPHVTGLIGLIWSASPALHGQVDQTYQIIMDTAVPLTGQNGSNCGGDYTVGPNNDWGVGTIDALAAVQAAMLYGNPGFLDGNVTDQDTSPLDGATITAAWDQGGQWYGTTDATGYYTMTLPNGTFTVTASLFGYYPQTVTGIVIVTDVVTTQDFMLTEAPTYTVSGYVRDASSGAPLDAQITIGGSPLPPVNTNPSTGFYSVVLPEGTYNFHVTASQYLSEDRTVIVDQNQTQDFNLVFQGEWVEMPAISFQYTRFDCVWFDDGTGASSYNQKAYCMGGRTGGSTELPDIWRYDPVTDTWSDTTHNMFEDVSNYTAVILNDENYASRGPAIYVVGGTNSDGGGGRVTYVQRYYPRTTQVENVTTDPWPGTAGGQVTMPGACVSTPEYSKLYCFGGFQNTAAPYNSVETYEYDPTRAAGSRWLEITTADLSVARGYIYAAVQGNLVYAIGGDIFDGSDLAPTTIVEVLDLADLAAGWEVKSPLPIATAEGRGFGMDVDARAEAPWTGKLYIAGGGDWSADSPEAMSYDISSDTWDQTFPDLNVSRRNHAGIFIPLCTPDLGDALPSIMVVGGRSGSDEPPFAPPEYYPLACEPEPILSLDKFVDPTQALPGAVVTYTIDYGNSGAVDAVGVLFTDTLPVDLTYVSSTPAGVYVTATHEVLWTLDVDAGTTGAITLVAEVAPDAAVNTSVTNTVVLKWQDQAALEAQATLEIIGLAPEAGFDFVTEWLSVAFTNTTVTGIPEATTYLWEFGDGITSTLEDPVHDYLLAGDYEVKLTATNDWASDEVTASITVTESPAAADLEIAKWDDPDPVVVGSPLTYTLVVTNLGEATATGVVVTDTLPEGVAVITVTASVGTCVVDESAITCDLGDLAVGQSATIVIVVTAPGVGGEIVNTAVVSAREPDPDQANNTTSETTTVIGGVIYLPVIFKQ